MAIPFCSGTACRREGESRVVLAIKTSMRSQLEEIPTGVSDRMITMEVPLAYGRYATMTTVYAPTIVCKDEVKEAFYNELTSIVRNVTVDNKNEIEIAIVCCF